MSLTASTPGTADQAPTWRPASSGSGVTFPRLVKSEWLKLKTLRSTWLTLGAAVVVLVLASALIANHLHGNLVHPRPFDDPNDRDVLTTPLRGFGITQLFIGVLGVLSITGEYATGMIRATLTAVPKRLPVLFAKLVVFALLGFIAMLVAAFGAFFTSQAVLGSYGMTLGDGPSVRVVTALAGYLALVGLLGVGLGFMVRSTAGGVASLVAIILVAPGILAALGTTWATSASHYLPLNAGLAMFSDVAPHGGELSPGAGLIVMLAWVAASVMGAAFVLVRRDG